MVEEQPYEQRATLEFERGNFLTKIGPDLAPDVPGIFPKLPAGAPRNRLTLAKWFFIAWTTTHRARCGQPLLGRALWDRHRRNPGKLRQRGRGAQPPELLDWLALHFKTTCIGI